MAHINKSLLAGTSTLAFTVMFGLASGAAHAQSFTVQNGQTVGSQTMNNAGDTGVVEAGGTVDNVGAGDGVGMLNDSQSLANDGTITTTGNNNDGVYSTGANATITQSGTITTTGSSADGIYSSGANAVINQSGTTTAADGFGIRSGGANASITLSGTIAVTGNSAAGIYSSGANAVINQSGTVTTTDNNSYAIYSDGANVTINNSGSIFTIGESSYGIYSNGANAVITNSGSISTTGKQGYGINTDNPNAVVTNTGSITTTGVDAHGILAEDDNSTITNSGLISATGAGADAIRFSQFTNTLILNPGSVIIGGLNFARADNTLTIGNGLSIANTFTGNLPATINTNGAPSAVSGMQVAVVDPTNLAAQDEFIGDLTGGISGAVQNRLGTMRSLESSAGEGVSALGFNGSSAPMSQSTAALSYGAMVQGAGSPDTGTQGWAQAFGSYRRQGADGPAVAADILVGGLVSGFDQMIDANTRAGFFVGGAAGNIDADYDSQETDVNTLFGGLYASKLMGSTALDFAVTVGFSNYDRERRVANNTAATGLETARADYDGWFISPELTLTQPVALGEKKLEASVTVRYSGLFLDGFTETGASDALTVDDRKVHVFQARGQLTMPTVRATDDGAMVRDAWYIGLEGRAQVGNTDVTGTLLAQNITFNPGGDSETAGIFAGYKVENTSADGTKYYAGVEGLVETGGSYQASGKVGVKFQF